MKNTNLQILELLSPLDDTAWRRLELFLRSPYHNTESRLLQLLTYYREGQLEAPEQVHARLYPDKSYAQRRWRAAQKRFLALLEAFYRQEAYQRAPERQTAFQISAYAHAQLPERALALATEARETWSAQTLPLWESLALRRQLSQVIYHSPAGRSQRTDISALLNDLQLEYLLLRLRYGVDILARGITYDEKGEQLQSLLPQLESLRQTAPLLDFYYQVYQAYAQEDPPTAEQLLALEEHYLRQYAELHPDDRTFWLIKLTNLFNRATQAGLPGFRAHLFRLYRYGIDRRLTLVNGRMTEINFLNLVSLGTAVGEWEWVNGFRKDFLPLLAIENTHNAACISKAYLHFHRQEHRAVNKALYDLRRPTLLHQFYARPLGLQSLLTRYLADSSLLGVLRSRLNTSYRWVYRDRRIAEGRKAEFFHFIKVIRAFVRVTEKRLSSEEARQYVRATIASGRGMPAREWALAMVDKL